MASIGPGKLAHSGQDKPEPEDEHVHSDEEVAQSGEDEPETQDEHVHSDEEVAQSGEDEPETEDEHVHSDEEVAQSGQDKPEKKFIVPDDFLRMPKCEFAHQAVCDKVTSSVAEIMYAHGKEEFLEPAIIFEIEKDFCCILFECSVMRHVKTRSFELRFLNSSQVLSLSSSVLASYTDQYTSLAAFSCNTAPNPYQSITLGQNVRMGQALYLLDLRFGTPSVTPGTVNFADDYHFVLSAKPHGRSYFGALVFDEDCKLVGIVFDHVGSVQAIQVDHLKLMLLRFFPETKTMADFFQKLKDAKDFVTIKRTQRQLNKR